MMFGKLCVEFVPVDGKAGWVHIQGGRCVAAWSACQYEHPDLPQLYGHI